MTVDPVTLALTHAQHDTLNAMVENGYGVIAVGAYTSEGLRERITGSVLVLYRTNGGDRWQSGRRVCLLHCDGTLGHDEHDYAAQTPILRGAVRPVYRVA